MRDLTLRQVEVIRAVMMTGTIQGAAEFLHVSAPGISRLVKHTEESLGVRLFERKAGLFVPAAEAAPVFEQIHQIYEKMSGLSWALDRLKRGGETELAFAAMPSIAQFVAAARGRAGPPALPRALHRPERAEDRGDRRLPAARARRVRRRELPLRPSLARLPAARHRASSS